MNPFDADPLQRVLQAVFVGQAREVAAKFNASHLEEGAAMPGLTHWVPVMVKAVKPLMTRQYQLGMLRSAARVIGDRTGPARRLVDANSEGLRHYELDPDDVFGAKRLRNRVDKAGTRYRIPDIRVDFDIFNPRVLDAVDEATFKFCRATTETARFEMDVAVKKLRGVLKRGLKKDIALKNFTRNIRRIFADTARARLIAVTETRRALYAGQVLAAKESGVVKKLKWVTNGNACDRCKALNNKRVKLDLPFHVDERGGPYALTYHPPLHPRCECDLVEML